MVNLHNIQFRYKKKRVLFDSLDLKLNGGSIYGLLGKNGAGKTTLLKHITGLLFPDQGECIINGNKVSDRSPEVLKEIFLIPEEFELPPVSIDRYVRANAPFYPRFNKEELIGYLNEFEIPVAERLSSMSFGQKKKFLISFGLAANTHVLILDEPTNGLDIPSKSKFRKIVASALSDEKLIVISTHQVRDLENLIDRVLILDSGKIVFNYDTAEISEKLRFVQDTQAFPPEEILYWEEMAGKRAGIVKNGSQLDSRIDLELLFNGTIKNSSAIETQLKNHSDYVY